MLFVLGLLSVLMGEGMMQRNVVDPSALILGYYCTVVHTADNGKLFSSEEMDANTS